MIRKAYKEDYDYLAKLIAYHKFENVYLYIDSIVYGFEDDNITTYVLEDKNKVAAIIYNYHNSLQILEIECPNSVLVEELYSYIERERIIRLSGSYSLLLRIFQKCKTKYMFSFGHIMKYKFDKNYIMSNQSYFATYDELDEVAKLIVDDPHLGKSYILSNLTLQLKSRYLHDGCENLCIKKDGIIISHFATYAIGEDVAILSGMVTKPEYRDKGYGSILVKDFSNYIYKKGITPILYCYEEEYYTWYQKLGYETIGESAKLEMI